MRVAKPIVAEHIRNIRGTTFGWVDHNFLHHGHLESLSQQELLLYYFLITVADRHGVSFYDYARICRLLKMETDEYLQARDRLCERSLIACQDGIFQVLSLPEPDERRRRAGSPAVKNKPSPVGSVSNGASRRKPSSVVKKQASRVGQTQILREILKMLDQ